MPASVPLIYFVHLGFEQKQLGGVCLACLGPASKACILLRRVTLAGVLFDTSKNTGTLVASPGTHTHTFLLLWYRPAPILKLDLIIWGDKRAKKQPWHECSPLGIDKHCFPFPLVTPYKSSITLIICPVCHLASQQIWRVRVESNCSRWVRTSPGIAAGAPWCLVIVL